MSESIREWYKKTTRKSLTGLVWAGILSSIGAILFYVFAPAAIHLKLQVFNGAIVIPVAGGIWIVSFILMWLVPMRETAFRSQESMERMESRFEERLKKVDAVIDRFDRISKAVEDGTHPLLNRLEDHVSAIRGKIDKDTRPLEDPRRRPRQPAASADSEEPPLSKILSEIEEMEDLHSHHGSGD